MHGLYSADARRVTVDDWFNWWRKDKRVEWVILPNLLRTYIQG